MAMIKPGSRWRFASVVAILMSLAVVSVRAEQTPSTSVVPGYTMPSTQMWDLKSDGGETYRIFVSYPAVEAPADGFPVLYVLDGNASFAAFAEARRIQERFDIGKSIVVGVGYPTDLAYDLRRLNDYTPPMLEPPPARWRQLAKYKSGGRDTFLDFMTGKLRTEIGKRFKIDPNRQSLFGHSLGGLLALHALYTRPQAFESIVAASPSVERTRRAARRARIHRPNDGREGRETQSSHGSCRWPRHRR